MVFGPICGPNLPSRLCRPCRTSASWRTVNCLVEFELFRINNGVKMVWPHATLQVPCRRGSLRSPPALHPATPEGGAGGGGGEGGAGGGGQQAQGPHVRQVDPGPGQPSQVGGGVFQRAGSRQAVTPISWTSSSPSPPSPSPSPSPSPPSPPSSPSPSLSPSPTCIGLALGGGRVQEGPE